MKRTWAGIALLAVVAGALILGLRWCAPTPPPPPGDYSKPGNIGGRAPAGVDRETTITITPRGTSFINDELKTLACGTPYKILAQATEVTRNCEGYNFQRLLDRADFMTNMRLAGLNCEPGCGPKRSRTLFVKSECRGRRATVSVKKEVVCPRPEDAIETAHIPWGDVPVTRSSETAVAGEDGNMAPPDRRGELITDLSYGSTTQLTLRCPEKLAFSTQYEEYEPGRCASFGAYGPYVARALERAQSEFYTPAACAGGCVKQPFAPTRTEWNCDATAGRVVVKTWFNIDCKRP